MPIAGASAGASIQSVAVSAEGGVGSLLRRGADSAAHRGLQSRGVAPLPIQPDSERGRQTVEGDAVGSPKISNRHQNGSKHRVFELEAHRVAP